MTAPLKQIKGALDAAKLATRGLDTQILALQKQVHAAGNDKKLTKTLTDQIRGLSLQKKEIGQNVAPLKDHVKGLDKASSFTEQFTGAMIPRDRHGRAGRRRDQADRRVREGAGVCRYSTRP